ncbi:hypothetical protein EXIGLDRAFT_745820 [Exidia glandulosa HHB12029]|uniref:Uncharacterized protein n=1 Tax=Exidia glandulosa HHB12029 TaxID=1314781 RepID=A0A166BCM8_EXIGL|nr:hypothetical protein EXIGLDRAFT_745820 [Exidia glandulosa HHB12029]
MSSNGLPAGFRWVHASNGSIPPDAVVAGKDKSGEVLHVARVSAGNRATDIGKCGSHLRGAVTASGGREHFHNNYEVLCGRSPNLKWVEHTGAFDLTKLSAGHAPIIGGKDSNGATLFITRIRMGSSDAAQSRSTSIGVQPGKVSALMQGASAAFNGQEYTAQKYEVLVHEYEGFSWIQIHRDPIPSGAIPAGHENGNTLYVARAFFIAGGPGGQKSIQVGKAGPHIKGASFSYGKGYGEILKDDVEIFVGDSSKVKWVSHSGPAEFDDIKGNPVLGGMDFGSHTLFIARVPYNDDLQVGKASVALLEGMHFSYSGQEIMRNDYEIMCYK